MDVERIRADFSDDEKLFLHRLAQRYKDGNPVTEIEDVRKLLIGWDNGSIWRKIDKLKEYGVLKPDKNVSAITALNCIVAASEGLMRNPPRDLHKETETRFKASPLAPYHFYAKELLPYFSIGISVLALIVSGLAMWSRWPDSSDKPSTEARPDTSNTVPLLSETENRPDLPNDDPAPGEPGSTRLEPIGPTSYPDSPDVPAPAEESPESSY